MGLGIKLLLIGMTTVFTMLLLVILSAKLLIKITDGLVFDVVQTDNSNSSESSLDHDKAIHKAIDLLSGGSKRIEEIRKL